MVKIEIEGTQYNIYTDLSEVSLEKYVAGLNHFSQQVATSDSFEDLIFFFSDTPDKYKGRISQVAIEELYKQTAKLLYQSTEGFEPVEGFELNGKKFSAHPCIKDTDGRILPMRKCTVEQYTNAADNAALLKDETEKVSELHQILSYLFTESGQPFDMLKAGDNAELFKQLPVSTACAAFEYFKTLDSTIHDIYNPLFKKPRKSSEASKKYNEKMGVWGWRAFVYENSTDMQSVDSNNKANIYEFLQLCLYRRMQNEASQSTQ